ncbi:OB-fold nucleic acid binding domain-containing protein, partial [Chloroflexota bacterium]
LESLIKSGAFDILGDRATLLSNVNRIVSLAQHEQRLRETGQTTMFDLWGETVPVPLAELNLEPAEISTKERLNWEKELLGVYLSEHPFSAVAGKVGSGTTLIGQIDAEMAGQNIVVAGMVASVRYLNTRDGRSFASAILEDLDGHIEVMVWPRVFEDKRELWEEGNIVLVQGKVRVREDQVQLNCDSVEPYRAAAPAKASVEIHETKAASPGEMELSGGEVVLPGNITPKIEEKVKAEPDECHLLTISLKQTADEVGDVRLLNKLVTTLRAFPGEDTVKLCIVHEDDTVDYLKLDATRYCEELHQRVLGIVGEDGFKLEKVAVT